MVDLLAEGRRLWDGLFALLLRLRYKFFQYYQKKVAPNYGLFQNKMNNFAMKINECNINFDLIFDDEFCL